jgi:serine-type D-Ala-D-Ala carboxypeptidase (penicillin-binding protein 5/6)
MSIPATSDGQLLAARWVSIRVRAVLSAIVMRLNYLAILLIATAAGLPLRAAQTTSFVISDNTTGMILDASGEGKKLQVGSLTKIATAMVVYDWAEATNTDLGQLATVPDSVAKLGNQPGVGFVPGDRCSVRDLLYAALLQSDNIAAETLADHVGRAVDGTGREVFLKQMNALARTLNMGRTRFTNPHGLDSTERSAPYSTAEDLAKLAAYAMKNPGFRFVVSQKERKITYFTANGEESQYLLRNTNELVGVSNIDGVKTGQTRKAGGCVIISSAKPPISVQNGEQVIVTPRRLNIIVLGSNDRFGVANGLLQRGWQLYDQWAAAGRPPKWKAPR